MPHRSRPTCTPACARSSPGPRATPQSPRRGRLRPPSSPASVVVMARTRVGLGVTISQFGVEHTISPCGAVAERLGSCSSRAAIRSWLGEHRVQATVPQRPVLRARPHHGYVERTGLEMAAPAPPRIVIDIVSLVRIGPPPAEVLPGSPRPTPSRDRAAARRAGRARRRGGRTGRTGRRRPCLRAPSPSSSAGWNSATTVPRHVLAAVGEQLRGARAGRSRARRGRRRASPAPRCRRRRCRGRCWRRAGRSPRAPAARPCPPAAAPSGPSPLRSTPTTPVPPTPSCVSNPASRSRSATDPAVRVSW